MRSVRTFRTDSGLVITTARYEDSGAERAMYAALAMAKRAVRIMRAVMDVATRYISWLAVVFTVCLIIPGPFDELGAMAVVAIYAAFKPAMRSDLRVAFRTK